MQRCQFGWYGISFQPEQESDVLGAFKEVTLEVTRSMPGFVLVRIDNDKYERFLELVLTRCHFSTDMYYTAGIVWGPKNAAEETKPDPGTERGA